MRFLRRGLFFDRVQRLLGKYRHSEFSHDIGECASPVWFNGPFPYYYVRVD